MMLLSTGAYWRSDIPPSPDIRRLRHRAEVTARLREAPCQQTCRHARAVYPAPSPLCVGPPPARSWEGCATLGGGFPPLTTRGWGRGRKREGPVLVECLERPDPHTVGHATARDGGGFDRLEQFLGRIGKKGVVYATCFRDSRDVWSVSRSWASADRWVAVVLTNAKLGV